MNETKYLWITNIPSKCKEEDVSRVLLRHGDIKATKTVHRNSCFNLIVEYLDRSSAARAVRSQNILRGNTLKVDYCDSFGNPWISSSNRSLSPTTSISQRFERKSSDPMLVDRAGPSSGPSGHHHHHSHHHHATTSQTPQSTPQHHSQQRGFQSPLPSSNMSSSSSSSSNSRPTLSSSSAVPCSTSLKVIFTPPPKYAETQIKQALCHELHRFGKTYHVNLLPASVTGGRQTRVALAVFRRAEDEEKAFLAFRNEARGLFGSPVHAEFCLGNNSDTIGSSPRLNRPPLTCSNIPIHSSTTDNFPSNNNHLTSSTTIPTSQQRIIRTSSSSTFSLPTRSLVVHGLTAGPNGPVSEVQLNTAFQRFGAILHVQMRPASNSAVIEFVELRGSTRAMTTHQRDPLRLGGRPLRLFYTLSRPINCLFINDLPASLAYQSEVELKSLFNRVAPVTQVLKITRSQEASANQSTTVHTCVLVELATHELATQLIDYLRSPSSPLVVAMQNRSSPDPLTTPRLPAFVCSVDYASPRQMEKLSPLKLRTSQTVMSQSQLPSLSSMANDKSRGPLSMSRSKDHSRLESSEEDHSQSSSTSNSSSLSSSKRSTTAETFPSQRRETPSYFPQKRLFPDPGGKKEAVVNRNHSGSLNSQEESNAFESMYDKIKRRTEGEKERRKRGASPELDDPLETTRKKKKRRKQHYETNIGDNDDICNEGGNIDIKETEEEMSKVKHKLKHSDSPASRKHGKNRSKNTSSRSSAESHRQKSRTTQPLSCQTKPLSTTITRLSLGMSVPMTANYHTIAKTPKRMSRLSESESSSSSISRSRSVSPSLGDVVDVKHHLPSNRRASDKGTIPSAFFVSNNKINAGDDINRSRSLNDAESASNYSSPASSLFQKRPKRQKERRKPSTPVSNAYNKKSEKRKMSSGVFKSSRASSSSLSTEEEGAGCRRYSSKIWSNPKSRFGDMVPNTNSTGGKRHKSKTTKRNKSKPKKEQSPILSDTSNRSASSRGSPFKRRGSLEDVYGINASTPLSSHGRLLSKLTPPSRNSDFHNALSDDDSLDDFDRISANTAMTPSTEAMEISPETGDEEPEHSVSEWFSRLSDNHSESEVEPEKDYEEDARCVVDEQKSLLINFEDLNMLNTSKEESLNLSNRDAIGDIKMEDQPSPRLNESSDKSKSLNEENSDVKVPSELTSSDEISVKPQFPSSPPKLDPGALPPPPPKVLNAQQIPSPYSSSSPTQSLCSACSRSSPSPIITAPVFTSRAGMTNTNTVTELTTYMKTVISTSQESAKPSTIHPGISENRDLKRYVQSVIERVKAETVDDTNPSTYRSANTTSANTPITSPLHHSLPASSSPHNPQSATGLPPPPSSTQSICKKATSPGTASNRRTSAATPPNLISSSSPPNPRKIFEASSVPSIPGVNACAPLLLIDPPTSTSPNSKPQVPPHIHETAGVEPKTPRSATRRRAKPSATAAASAPAASTTVNVAPLVEIPKQATDPYEPNFDDDSPPRVKSVGSSASPLIVNTLLSTEHPGPASTVSSVTTNDEGPPLSSTIGNEAPTTKTSTVSASSRKGVMDSVDETISDVCSGRFDMRSYLETWGLQPPTTTTGVTTAASISNVVVSNSAPPPILNTPVATTSVVTTTASAVKLASEASKHHVASAATNNPIVTAIINALQSITGSPVMIGTSGVNNTAGTVRQGNSAAVCQQIPAKPSNVVVGSSPPTISATTITFPVIIKNFSAANTTTKTAPTPIIKSSVANSQPVTMTTGSISVPQQPASILHQSPQQHQVDNAVAMSRPHSSATDTPVDSSHPYRVRRGSDNNIGPPPQVDDIAAQQRPLFNNPRGGFTSPPPQPRYHQFATPPPTAPGPRHIPPPWNRTTPGPFPRPDTSSSTTTTSPNTTYPPPPTAAALVEKLSCLIDHPDLVLPMLQTMMQEGQHLDPEWLGSVLKMFQQYSPGGGGDNGLPGPHPGGIANNSNSSPVQPPSVSSSHPSRATPPFQRSGGFDQASIFYLTIYPSSTFLAPSTYPLVWQGRLSLKNSEVSVALHYVQGNTDLLRACISTLAAGGGGTPQQALVTSGGPLRIVQRMRLEASQLDAVQRKIGQEGAACACVAFASGANRADLAQQNVVLEEGFIRYMLEKGAAGIINVGQPGSVQKVFLDKVCIVYKATADSF
ncbi:unnamed protein product [Rodentolepis nana]|uniref:RRM domain-containing protein n=1 Tax=Rodentolepis nana TaxID=102285 RepID=A0A0R3TLG4_RODNA|nr:unnamed protein product [Rodentolepis nana]